MQITVIGAGYVGLVTGTCLADFGHHVVCVDTDAGKIAKLREGEIPIYEPGLSDLVKRNVAEERLDFAVDLTEAVRASEAVFIAVGTPSRRGDGFADLSYVYAAAEQVGRALDGFTVVVNKSTVPVGTGDEVEARIRAVRPDAEFEVVSNPEFLREGAAIDDFKRPDRIVIGTDDQRARDVMSEIYRPLYLNQTPIVFTSRRSAEVIKYAANAFLAVKITFINEVANLCEEVDANVQHVAHAIGLDKRIGSKFLHAGPGFGGSCFPKDLLALSRTANDAGAPLQIVDTVISVNDTRKQTMAEKVITACGGSVEGKTIAVLGLTFKPNTDDMREAPSLDIVPALQSAGATVVAFDPKGMDEARPLLNNVKYAESAYDAIEGADAMAIVTEWDQFRALDLDRVKAALRSPIVVDYRNIYDVKRMREHGFEYTSVGRPSAAF